MASSHFTVGIETSATAAVFSFIRLISNFGGRARWGGRPARPFRPPGPASFDELDAGRLKLGDA